MANSKSNHKTGIFLLSTLLGINAWCVMRFLLHMCAMNQSLKKISEKDELTQLLNKRGLHSKMRRRLKNQHLQRQGAILMDVDHFKAYNDYYGHCQGDCVLAKIAYVIQQQCDTCTDCVVRYGGEEFLVLVDGTYEKDVIILAEKIRKAIEKANIPHATSPIKSYITISSGISVDYVCNTKDYERLIKFADRGLYKSKYNGRNRCTYYKRNERRG